MRLYTNLFVILYHVSLGDCRKYDLEAEAIKLYGEDLQSLLKRFRKTPEYVSILEDKFSDLKTNIEAVMMDLLVYYHTKTEEKLLDMFYPNNTEGSNVKRGSLRKHTPPFRRQNGDEADITTKKSGVEFVDSYKMLKSPLTVEERNKFKDMGFEFAGHLVHALINAVSGDGPHSSTLLPYGVDDPKGVESTLHDHHVTHEPSTLSDEPTTTEGHQLHTQPPETYRNYKPAKILKD